MWNNNSSSFCQFKAENFCTIHHPLHTHIGKKKTFTQLLSSWFVWIVSNNILAKKEKKKTIDWSVSNNQTSLYLRNVFTLRRYSHYPTNRMVGTKKKMKLRENAGGWKGQTVWGARDSEYLFCGNLSGRKCLPRIKLRN